VKLYVNIRWILIAAALPFVVLGLLVLVVQAYNLFRHDPAYFTPAYLEQYESPGEVVWALETALQSDDEAQLAELQALRWPAEFYTSPSIIFVMLWERTDRYFTYLYFDMQTYERHPHYVEEVNGRWVVAPPDIYYYINSGQWKRVFFPLAIIWWLLSGIATGALWVFRASERARARLLGE
jgi:hypothetical protein